MKRLVSGIVLTLLLISMLTLAFNIQPVKAEPRTWYVDDSGGADFTKIQDAVYAASAGDTIYVYNGTYHEHIYISKSLSLIGENKHATIIDGSGYAYAVTVFYTQGVKFTRFTICNAEIGIDISQSSNNTIVDNIVTNSTLGGPYWGGGIYLDYSSNNTVAGNIILNTTEVGIWLNSYNNTVVNNTISGAVEPVPSSCGGIHLEDGSHDNTIRGNIISKRAYGIYLAFWSDTNNIVGNTILNLSYNVPYGIIVWSSNNWIIGNTIMNVDYTGIRLNSPEGYPNRCINNVVSGNVVSNASNGIEVSFKSSFNTLIGNNVSNSGIGITICNYSNNNTLNGNVLTYNSLGIDLWGFSENNKINGNVMTNNSYGIDIIESSDNKVSNNNVTTNTYSNIYIHSSTSNTICSNIIANSQNGLMFLYSSNNNVYHNDFINNTEQVYSYDSTNVWDDGYPSGGNYWRDYTGADLWGGPYQNETGSDGIGDAPYVIDAENVDNYPLMKPYARLLGDLNYDGKVDITDIAMASQAFGSYPGHPRWNPLADVNNDSRVDIYDIARVCADFGKT
jgi:parallel beta-helix repeat protein